MKILDNERKYIIEAKVGECSLFKKLVRWYWTGKVSRMTEGEILKLYRDLVDQNRPLVWLNGGEN